MDDGRSCGASRSNEAGDGMNAQAKYNLETTPAYILADGPYETDGDGGFEYVVCFGDYEGEAITENKKAVWKMWDYDELVEFSHELSVKFNLELIFEANPA